MRDFLLALFPAVSLPPSGALTLDFAMPNHPSLIGLELHIQALHIGAPGIAGRHAWSRRSSDVAAAAWRAPLGSAYCRVM
ncbi:MAG: hypothetical protein AAF628_26470 [Planctomycetota bacterium]